MLIYFAHSPKTKEAALYVLKQILDEMSNSDEASTGDDAGGVELPMNADSARTLMGYISLAMQDGTNRISFALLFGGHVADLLKTITSSEHEVTLLRVLSPSAPRNI